MTGRDEGLTIVVALGGNAILRAGEKGTIEQQSTHAKEAMRALADLLEGGGDIVITHGNGPVVGNIVMRGEAARLSIPPMPLYIANADSEGGVGYLLQQALHNELVRRGIDRQVITLVTQTVVDPEDPAFSHPTKPIGPYVDRAEADILSSEHGWAFAEEIGKGWRRVVPSPLPVRIVEGAAVRALVSLSWVVIAAGGGGIPVVEARDGTLSGVDAVVDKDWAGALLALDLDADMFAVLMEADGIYRDFGTATATLIERLTTREARKLLRRGMFGEGTVAPKVAACAHFVEETGREALICGSESLASAIARNAGTRIVPE
ncbi:MAG: carbamate kinase [Coriobacteriia bacterium]|nr:carbamate kinase [Coriobacteriia bacterium]